MTILVIIISRETAATNACAPACGSSGSHTQSPAAHRLVPREPRCARCADSGGREPELPGSELLSAISDQPPKSSRDSVDSSRLQLQARRQRKEISELQGWRRVRSPARSIEAPLLLRGSLVGRRERVGNHLALYMLTTASWRGASRCDATSYLLDVLARRDGSAMRFFFRE